jgi:hypothetical protein
MNRRDDNQNSDRPEEQKSPGPAGLFRAYVQGGRDKLKEELATVNPEQVDNQKEPEQVPPESDVFTVDPNMWATMTEDEQAKYFRELLRSGKNFILDGVRYAQDSNPGPISTSFSGQLQDSSDENTSNTDDDLKGRRWSDNS